MNLQEEIFFIFKSLHCDKIRGKIFSNIEAASTPSKRTWSRLTRAIPSAIQELNDDVVKRHLSLC